jgi:hypothetical protein
MGVSLLPCIHGDHAITGISTCLQDQSASPHGSKPNKYGYTPLIDVLQELTDLKVGKVEDRLAEHQRFVQAKGLLGVPAMHAVNGQLRPYSGNAMVRSASETITGCLHDICPVAAVSAHCICMCIYML